MRADYPINLDVTGREAVVIGGAAGAAHRARALLRAGARVRIVAPALSPAARRLVERGRVGWTARRLRAGDLRGAAVAVLTVRSDAALARRALAAARRHGVAICAVDRPAASTFSFPAIARAGSVAVAVSTAGTAPALAARLRREIGRLLAPRLPGWAAHMARERERLRREQPDPRRRAARLRALAARVRLRGRVDCPAPPRGPRKPRRRPRLPRPP